MTNEQIRKILNDAPTGHVTVIVMGEDDQLQMHSIYDLRADLEQSNNKLEIINAVKFSRADWSSDNAYLRNRDIHKSDFERCVNEMTGDPIQHRAWLTAITDMREYYSPVKLSNVSVGDTCMWNEIRCVFAAVSTVDKRVAVIEYIQDACHQTNLVWIEQLSSQEQS